MRYEKISAAPKQVPPHIETNPSEEALLEHHADSAVGAMRDLLTKIHGDMSRVADPREWAERYPWATVAAAAAAGFVAAKVIKPRSKAPSPAAAPYVPPAAPGADPAAGVAADLERARYEAYLRDAAQARAAGEPPPSPREAARESVWTPLVEMAKSAAARYIMSAAQAGIAAFAAAHAAKAATEDEPSDAGAQASSHHNDIDAAPDGFDTASDFPPR